MSSARALQRAAYAAATGLGIWAFTTWLGLRPRPLLVVLVTVSCFVVMWLMADLADRVERIEWSAVPRRTPTRRGLDPRFSHLARDLRENREPDLIAQRIHNTLLRVVDERLWAHHGIDRIRQPAQAAALMDDALSHYLSAPPRARRGQTAYLDDIIDRIERL